jgi:hypothetical protein
MTYLYNLPINPSLKCTCQYILQCTSKKVIAFKLIKAFVVLVLALTGSNRRPSTSKEDDKLKFGPAIPIFEVWKYNTPCADVGGICIFKR